MDSCPWIAFHCLPWFSVYSAPKMLVPLENPQSIANTLGYLQHYLQQLTKKQNNIKNNINITLTAPTIQLQQLTQLVRNLALTPVASIPPPQYYLPYLCPLPCRLLFDLGFSPSSLCFQTSTKTGVLVKHFLTPALSVCTWYWNNSIQTWKEFSGCLCSSRADEQPNSLKTSSTWKWTLVFFLSHLGQSLNSSSGLNSF